MHELSLVKLIQVQDHRTADNQTSDGELNMNVRLNVLDHFTMRNIQ